LAPPAPNLLPTDVQFVRALENINIRSGPGTQFSRISFAARGAVVQVFGISPDRGWWNVLCPDNTMGNCWMSANPSLTQPTGAPEDGAPTRIQFARGAVSATVTGNVVFPQHAQYILRARAGQVMTVQIQSPESRANFAITGVDDGQPYKRLVNEDRSFTFTLPSTQDYLIAVAVPDGSANFSLTVTIVWPDAPPPAQPVRINFTRGAVSATVNGSVAFPQQPQYILKAMAGQVMTVQIHSAGDQANFAITGVDDGQPYKRLVNEDRTFTFTLPRTQDYLIAVGVPGGNANFSLTVTIVWPDAPPPQPPIRIRFAPGAISATRTGYLPANSQQDYLLGARAGQQMDVYVNTSGGNVLLAITGADGTPYKRFAVGGPAFSFTLPATQDYTVSVRAEGGAASYELAVTIE
jgi:hypothetical protein